MTDITIHMDADLDAMTIDELETLNTELGADIDRIRDYRRSILAVHGEKTRIARLKAQLGVDDETAVRMAQVMGDNAPINPGDAVARPEPAGMGIEVSNG